MLSLAAHEIQEITARHLISTPLKPADLLFVFGTRDGVPQFVEAILALWRGGYFKNAIVSGGMTPGSDRTECEIIKALLVDQGIPADIILEEHRATNTGENVIFSLPIIDEAIGLDSIKSVICLGKVCTSRRYPMTLHRHWPQVEKMLVAVNYFGTPVEDWHVDPAFRERVVREWGKIEPYLAKGFIAEWPRLGAD